MSQPTADDVLMMAGIAPPSAQWGDFAPSTVEGRVVAKPRTYHAREYDPSGQNNGKLKFYQSGDAVYGISIDLKVDQATLARDGAGVNDDTGIRRLYADKTRLLQAIKEAVLVAQRPGIEPEGYLRVTWTGTEMGKGSLPANTYSAVYFPPGAPVAAQQVSQAQVFAQNGGDIRAQQAAYAAQAAAPYAAQQVPQTESVGGRDLAPRVIKASAAAALANAGVDLSPFTIVPD